MQRPLLLLGSLLSLAATGHAQNPAAAKTPDPITHVTFGQSAVPLYGPWKFMVGDSPMDSATGKPLWAESGFDDSHWENVDLTPRPGMADPWNADPRYVPGWTSLGHPGYMGWAWYRITVSIPPILGERLAVDGPYWADDAYQVYADGKLLGGFGKFGSGADPPKVFFNQPAMFALPSEAAGKGAGEQPAQHTLAFRVWMGLVGMQHSLEPGGLHYAPFIGGFQAIAAQNQLDWNELFFANCFEVLLGLVFILLAIVAACLILFDRSDPVYAWVAGVLLLEAGWHATDSLASVTPWISHRTSDVIETVTGPIQLAGWMMVWWVWFRLRRPAWLPKAIFLLTLASLLFGLLDLDLLPWTPSHAVGVAIDAASTCFWALSVGLLIFILVRAIQEHGWSGLLVIPAILPIAMSGVWPYLSGNSFGILWHPFGITVAINLLSDVLMTVALALLMLQRLLASLQRQRIMALDVKQAQEVQQVILPEARLRLSELSIESEYRPALEVGGDFFQIIPHETDGSVLIVAGDVSGKGLQAGMLVALLVGAIRTAARFSDDPVVVLGELNRRLMGRSNAQATCLALRIDADGRATLANAGHVAPYLNGEELPMEGALPLGIFESAVSSIMHFQLHCGDKLVLMSDGIAEATDSNGHLFGFDRVHALLRTATTAAEVATAAQRFGQNDDISVITLTRVAAYPSSAI